MSTRSNEDCTHETSGTFYKINSEEQIIGIGDEHSKIYSHIAQNQQQTEYLVNQTKQLPSNYHKTLAEKFSFEANITEIEQAIGNWPIEQLSEFSNQLELFQTIHLNQKSQTTDTKFDLERYTKEEILKAYQLVKKKYEYKRSKSEAIVLLKHYSLLYLPHQKSFHKKNKKCHLLINFL